MNARGTIISTALDLAVEDCIQCGVLFAFPRELRLRLMDNHATFYCPSGHPMVFTGKTEAQKERERREAAERDLEWMRSSRNAARDQAQASERQARAYKGHVTRLRNRIAAGVCPVQTCRRNFANVKAHIASQHPDWAHDHPEALSP